MSEATVPKSEHLKVKREANKLKNHLTRLTTTVLSGLAEIDKLGERKDIPDDAGRRLAKITNAIEMANDQARYFGLGVDYRSDDKRAVIAGVDLAPETQ